MAVDLGSADTTVTLTNVGDEISHPARSSLGWRRKSDGVLLSAKASGDDEKTSGKNTMIAKKLY